MRRARSGSAGSTLRLAFLVLEGYAYLFGTILVLAGVVGFFAWGVIARHPIVGLLGALVGLPAGLAAGSAVRALFFRLPEPSGPAIAPDDGPELAGLIEEVRRCLGAPKIHRVQVGTGFNASAVQYPRLGLFWSRNLLVIGYPLLIGLSPEQLKAVIAHELAHLRHAHATVAGWLFRTRHSWMRLSAALQQRGLAPIFVRWILAHYVPRLESRSMEIARAHEALADRRAIEVVGGRAAAETLLAMELGQCWIEDVYWPSLHDRVATEGEPRRPFSEMRRAFIDTAEQHATPELLARLLEDETTEADTHPCLRERLQATGEEARLPPRPTVPAGQVYLGAYLDVLAERLDRMWQEREGTGWRERNSRHCRALGRLAELAARPALSADELHERGSLLAELGRPDEALAAWQAAHATGDGHARAALAAGDLLLHRGDPSGALLIRRAMELDAALALEACDRLAEHYEAEGQALEAERYRAQARRHATEAAIRQAERSSVTPLDLLEPHGLREDALQPLMSALRNDARILRAYLTRKRLRHSRGWLFVLGVVAKEAPAIPATELLSAESCLVLLDRSQRALQGALQSVPESEIYVR
jgi:Zn-dependent protease with chaperone function